MKITKVSITMSPNEMVLLAKTEYINMFFNIIMSIFEDKTLIIYIVEIYFAHL